MEIIPAIIPQNLDDLEDKLASVRKIAPIVQIDVLDGSLAPSRCWPYQSPTKRDDNFDAIIMEEQGFPFWQDIEFEAHLMVRSPELIIDDWISAGATRIIIQLEGVNDFKKCLEIVDGRVPFGVALALDTPIEKLAEIGKDVTIIQLMGWNISNLGLQGRPFDEGTFERVRELRQAYPEHIISIDGGVNLENAPELLRAGASRLVVGSALWENGSVRDNFAEFKRLK